MCGEALSPTPNIYRKEGAVRELEEGGGAFCVLVVVMNLWLHGIYPNQQN